VPDGVYSLSCNRLSDTLVVRVQAYNRPGDIFTVDMKTGVGHAVYRASYAGLDPAHMVKPESIRLNARDGVEVQGLLYLPKTISSDNVSDRGLPYLPQMSEAPPGLAEIMSRWMTGKNASTAFGI